MRRFKLVRLEDETGLTGIGAVAEGVEFGDGRCVMRWNQPISSIVIHRTIEDIETIHGHGGKSRVEFIDGQGQPAGVNAAAA